MTAEALTIQSIGKYQILGILGRGTMGMVYKARDPEIERVVAIKTLRRVHAGSIRDTDVALERFRNEARSAGNLRHPNIVTVFEANRSDDMPYLVMDLVEGEGLDTLIARSSPLDPRQAISIVAQVGAALDYAHSKNILHRDIKPSNVVMDAGGVAYVLDFGVATLIDSCGAGSPASGSPILGTPGYMSPEQILNQKLTGRSDLFSLAVVSFECLTGRRPFDGDTFSSAVGAILGGKPVSLSSLVPSLPLALEAEFERALAKDPANRFATAHEMVAAFGAALGFEIQALSFDRTKSGVIQGRKRASSGWRSLRPAKETRGRILQPNIHQKHRAGKGASDGQTMEMLGSLSHARGHARELKRSTERGLSSKMLRGLTLGFALASVAVGIGLLWLLFGESESAQRPTIAESVNSSPHSALEQNTIRASLPYQVTRRVTEMSEDELLKTLRDPGTKEDVLLQCLESARERRPLRLVEALFVPLRNDSYVVRVEAIKLLAELGDPQAVPELVAKLDDYDPVVRGYAAKALGSLGDRRALGYLTVRYQREEIEIVKSALKRAIEKINGYPLRD